MTRWTDHVKREARRLGLSYGCAMTDERVKQSYREGVPKKAKAKSKAKAKAKAIRSRSPSRSSSKSSDSSYTTSSGSSSGSRSMPLQSPRRPQTRSQTRAQQPGAKRRPNSTQQTLRSIMEMSPIRSPKIPPKPSSTKKTLKAIIEMSPIKTPDYVKRQRAGVVGRKTGAKIKRNVRRGSGSLEDVDEFFDQFSSSGSSSLS